MGRFVIFEGFKPNGLQIRHQRISLHRIAPVKMDVDLCLIFVMYVFAMFDFLDMFGIAALR